jgi:FMN phosphatase YigB (HAD superfamily)
MKESGRLKAMRQPTGAILSVSGQAAEKVDRTKDLATSERPLHEYFEEVADIFRLALDIAEAPGRQVVHIEDTPMFVQIAESLGIRSILHTDYQSTRAKLAPCGLQNYEKDIHETR